ncbi:MAG: phytanoyl-CoA dioxygenase family protein, partial [Alphaproteobacteria bacterium]
VKWHQDFPFTPHSNDSLVTALLMMDDVDEENGPLEVCPETHRGPLHSLWHDGTFTGAVASDVTENARKNHVTCLGKAGSVCLMHTRLLHGSAPNTSTNPRTLFIWVYRAVEAIHLSPSPVRCTYQGHIVRGRDNGVVRTSEFALEMPALPKGASFFDQQSGQSMQ